MIHKRCTLSCSQSTTQVDVPSTCTTKDVPSNLLRQRILRQLVLWNLLFKRKGRIKRILRLSHFEFFDKGEGRHKRIQAVSPLFFWKGRRETQKEFRRLVLSEFFLAKGEEMKRMNSTSFQGLENLKTLESFLAQWRRRSSKRLWNQCGKIACVKNELEKIDV